MANTVNVASTERAVSLGHLPSAARSDGVIAKRAFRVTVVIGGVTAVTGAITVTAVRPERATWIGLAMRVIGATRVTGVSGAAAWTGTIKLGASSQPRSSELASSASASRAAVASIRSACGRLAGSSASWTSRMRRISAFAAS